jgi:hypothetical protein
VTEIAIPTAALGLDVPESSRRIDIRRTCRDVETWAATTTDIPALRNVSAKLAAIDQYLAATDKRHRGQLAATLRRLEIRVGELLGPATQGARNDRRPELSSANESLTANERRDFRDLAERRDDVERMLDESTDDDPASRRAVLAALRQPERPRPQPRTCPTCGATERHWTRQPKGVTT